MLLLDDMVCLETQNYGQARLHRIKLRPRRSTDQAASTSNSGRTAAVSIRSNAGRLSRYFAPPQAVSNIFLNEVEHHTRISLPARAPHM
jgi:hypothetical protein